MFLSIFSKISPTLIVREAKQSKKSFSEYEQRLVDSATTDTSEVLRHLGSAERGLDEERVKELHDEHGLNEISQGAQKSWLDEIIDRCKNPLVVQLLIIAGVSFLMHDLRSGIVVSVMLVLSVLLSYFQEAKSSKAIQKLRDLVQTHSLVVRDGKETEVPMAEIVPGDIVVLQAGSIIPADVRLLTTKDFFVGQSALTGESMPIEKSAAACTLANKSLIELGNICFQGSNVLSGSARGVVVNTGTHTYLGSISLKLSGHRSVTSFDKGIHAFTWFMIRWMVVMVAIVFLVIGLTKGTWMSALLFGLAIAVGLTPEMLPMIVTVNLSKGALVMSRKKVIVKHLHAIQNFGAMNILCTDKTGTLTQDRIVLEKYVDVTNRTSEDVLRYAYMNSYYQTGLRNLLDRAVLAHVDLEVEHDCKKVDEIPFDFSRKRMSVIIDHEDAHVLICKGAVEEVYKTCTHYQVDDEIHPLIDVLKNDLMEEYETLSRDGYRVVAIAYREYTKDKHVFSVADEAQLILLGYIAFFDPPKDSSARAIKQLQDKGVVVKVLTGDNALVTQKICRDVGLDVTQIVTGDQLQGLSEDDFSALADKANVFARLSPLQKEQLIMALQKRGHVVGFLGDGINDAPAMKAADVGISVDTAADVAKESADIVLLEKSLLVLEDGIIEGRKVFGNIIKYIRMSASSNFGNMFSMVGSSYMLPFLPMTPLLVLLNNLLYDFSQIGIPSDRVDEEFMQTPRRWNIANIKRFMLFLGPVSSLFDYITFFVLLYVFGCHGYAGATGSAKIHFEQFFQTGWFIESLLTQTLIVHIIRTRKIPFLQSCASPMLLLTTFSMIAIGVYLPYSPFAKSLGMVPLPWSFWPWLAGIIVCYALVAHTVKSFYFKKFGID